MSIYIIIAFTSTYLVTWNATKNFSPEIDLLHAIAFYFRQHHSQKFCPHTAVSNTWMNIWVKFKKRFSLGSGRLRNNTQCKTSSVTLHFFLSLYYRSRLPQRSRIWLFRTLDWDLLSAWWTVPWCRSWGIWWTLDILRFMVVFMLLGMWRSVLGLL